MSPGGIARLVVLDACVLFRGMLTDLLLCPAEAECFDPVWSDEIHAEWTRSLLARRGPSLDRVDYRRAAMERAFPSANIPVDAGVHANVLTICHADRERKDAHVLATAIASGADTILTDNFSDFLPLATRLGHRVRLAPPDEFVSDLYASNEGAVLAGARVHLGSLRYPAYDPDSYLTLLSSNRVGLPRASALHARHKHEL